MPNTLIAAKADDHLENMTHWSVLVGTASVLVAPANQYRRCLTLINDSDTLIYVTYGVPAQLHLGFRLEKYGGTLPIHSCSPAAVYAICSSNSKRILVNEGT